MASDGRGRPLKLILTPGQVNDITQAPALLERQTGAAVLADKAYDKAYIHENEVSDEEAPTTVFRPGSRAAASAMHPS